MRKVETFDDCPGFTHEDDKVGAVVSVVSLIFSAVLIWMLHSLQRNRKLTLGRRYWSVLLLNAYTTAMWSINYLLAFYCDVIITKQVAHFSQSHHISS